MKITKSDFGTLNTGENIYIYHMENANGAYVEVINFGCRLVKIVVPDRDGKMTDVCLGFDSMEDYARDNASLGAVVGRVANRITMNSYDGEEGYPGNLTLSVTYGWSEDNELSLLYEASTDADTLLNVTSHGYFNLNGEGSSEVLSHELFIDADQITELDDSQAPTGRFLPVEGTPFDFRSMHTIGKLMDSDYEQYHKFGTYDHNFVINGTGFREAAVLQSKESGIRMTCFTDQPGMQLYVANQPIEVTGKNGTQYACHTSVCLETQHFPDAINHDNFPSIVLTPDEPFRSKTLYHFSTF